MIDQPFSRLVESLAAKTPTPGGGAAAAMAGCMGAALFLMVVRFSRGKKANLDRDVDLQRAETALQGCLDRLLPMAEADCKAFDHVSAAFALPKETEAHKTARNQAIQKGLAIAMDVPLRTLGMVHDVFGAIAPVIGCIGKAIASDLASGASLLHAGAEGAFLNVKINATSIEDKVVADRAMAHATQVRTSVQQQTALIAALVDKLLA